MIKIRMDCEAHPNSARVLLYVIAALRATVETGNFRIGISVRILAANLAKALQTD